MRTTKNDQIFFYLLLRRSIADHYLRSCGYVTCSRPQRTANGDFAQGHNERRLGDSNRDLSAQSPRLYHCASPLQIVRMTRLILAIAMGKFDTTLLLLWYCRSLSSWSDIVHAIKIGNNAGRANKSSRSLKTSKHSNHLSLVKMNLLIRCF